MAQYMKDGGKIIKQMEKADLYMLMEMYMMAIGLMIKLMVLVYTAIQMVLNMKDIGKKINKIGMVLKYGLTEQNMKDNI